LIYNDLSSLLLFGEIIVILLLPMTLYALLLAAAVVSSNKDIHPIAPVKRDTKAFLDAMAMRESGNDPKAVNQFGYLGKYQFSMSTLRTMKVKTTKYRFLHDEQLQDSVMKAYLRDQWASMWRMHKYVGRHIHGVKITKSGMLAAAHLIGVGGVCTMFEPTRCNYPTKDGNGVDGLEYLRKFANYEVSLTTQEK